MAGHICIRLKGPLYTAKGNLVVHRRVKTKAYQSRHFLIKKNHFIIPKSTECNKMHTLQKIVMSVKGKIRDLKAHL